MRQKYLILFVTVFFITYLTISHVDYPPIVYDYDRLEKDTEIKPLPMVNCLGSNSHEERYMTYLPHSGFHNQRISLENAIFLSWVLNRTLIIPPILFAKKNFIPHRHFDLLYKMLNGNLTNSARACKIKGVEDPACMFTQLDWEELMNFEFVKKNIRYIYRKDLTFNKKELYSYLNITKPKSQVYTLAEETRYDFQFYDDASITQVSDPQFRYLTHICSLQRREEKLIHFGSVYSLVRLNLKYRENIEFYNAVKENMIINHPVLVETGERIAEQLGGLGGYVGVHLRLGDNRLDKKFGEKAKENVDNTIREVSKRIETPVSAPLDVVDTLVPTETMIDAEKCIQSIPPEQRHIPIIYLASDKPRKDIRLRRFFREFPCVFMLITNFSEYLDGLRTVKNPRDGALLYRYFVPMVDGIVAAGGGEFYGTPESTFTDYVYRLHVHWVGS